MVAGSAPELDAYPIEDNSFKGTEEQSQTEMMFQLASSISPPPASRLRVDLRGAPSS
jgi:hypothetical protein